MRRRGVKRGELEVVVWEVEERESREKEERTERGEKSIAGGGGW